MLWLIPGVFLFYIWSFKRKQNLINRFVIKELRDRLLSGVSVTRQKIKALLLVGVIVFIVLSLIRPQWGFKWEEIKRKGVDIIVALDVSSSMLAEDVSPNRLERAKREIIDLLNILQGDRVGLIAFAGARVIQGTVKEELPEGFQRSEYVEKTGFVDLIVERQDLASKIGTLLSILLKQNSVISSEQNETSEDSRTLTKAAS